MAEANHTGGAPPETTTASPAAITSDDTVTADVADLNTAFPRWLVTTTWAAVGTGPDVRVFIAQHDTGAIVAHFTPAGLADRMTAEENRLGWAHERGQR